MLRFSSLRIAAATFAFVAASGVAPVLAQTAPARATGEATYAAEMRTVNPTLSLDKARAYARSVMASAWRTHLDPRFIMSIVTVESAWHANAVSRVGACGLGQLMPATAAILGVNPRNASENLRGTSAYLATLMSHFAGKRDAMTLAIAGYNAGPKAVERFHGIPPYAETRHYVVKVLRVWNQLKGRVGNAFAPAPVATVAVSPDVREWLTDTAVLPPALTARAASTSQPTSVPANGTPAAAESAGAEAPRTEPTTPR